MRFLTTTLGNMAGIWVAAWLLPTVDFRQGEAWQSTLFYLFVIATVLTGVNWLIRPVIRVLAFPLYILTLGLFALVTNGLVFFIVGWASSIVRVPLVVDGWGGAIWGGTITAIVAAIVGGLLSAILPSKPAQNGV